MSIFNSLGSNYTLKTVGAALFTPHKKKYHELLTAYLEKKYKRRVVLTYKGREALTLGLAALTLPKNTRVAFNGFTCDTIHKTIISAGLTPVAVDIEKGTLHFSAKELQETLKKHPDIKAVIVQNTLGIPCDIGAIAAICKKNSCILIEDLAHSVGATYTTGQEAGAVGDFTVLSFSQDKIIDAISGGAVIVKNGVHYKRYTLKTVPKLQQLKDRLYPLLTFIIRQTYPFGFGKLLHFCLKKIHALSQPMTYLNHNNAHGLPAWQCRLALQEFMHLESNLVHRRVIAQIYADHLPSSPLSKKITDHIQRSANLRFPIFTGHRNQLIAYLKKHGIYAADTWYDRIIAYDLVLSQQTAETIVNLPTHAAISEKDALHIVSCINQWKQPS